MNDTRIPAPDPSPWPAGRWPERKWWRLRKFRRDTKGVTAIEFAIIAAPFFALMFAIMEVAFWFIGMQVLENAVDQAGRKARTGEIINMSQQAFIDEICSKTVGLLPSCNSKLLVKVQPYNDFNSSGFTNPNDPNGNLDPNATSSVTPCPPNAVCVVEAFYEWDLLLNIPGRLGKIIGTTTDQEVLDLGTGGTNGKTILRASMVFRSEPYL